MGRAVVAIRMLEEVVLVVVIRWEEILRLALLDHRNDFLSFGVEMLYRYKANVFVSV